jgi:hypothetical protein
MLNTQIERIDAPRAYCEFADIMVGDYFAMETNEVLCLKINDTEFLFMDRLYVAKWDPLRSNKVIKVYARLRWNIMYSDRNNGGVQF